MKLFFLFLGILGISCLPSTSIDASFNMERFHVCTVSSKPHFNLNKLIESCEKHHINLEILGMGLPYYADGTKFIYMNDYINTLDDDEIVMFVDAFDVLIVADKQIILDTFLSFESPFVMSSDTVCIPHGNRANEFPQTSTRFKYINTGTYIGYVKNLREWFTSLQPIDPSKCDQRQAMDYYLASPENRNVFTLDYQCELFLPLLKVYRKDAKKNLNLKIDLEKQRVYCCETDSYPCVIHANGRSFTFWNMAYKALIQPE